MKMMFFVPKKLIITKQTDTQHLIWPDHETTPPKLIIFGFHIIYDTCRVVMCVLVSVR